MYFFFSGSLRAPAPGIKQLNNNAVGSLTAPYSVLCMEYTLVPLLRSPEYFVNQFPARPRISKGKQRPQGRSPSPTLALKIIKKRDKNQQPPASSRRSIALINNLAQKVPALTLVAGSDPAQLHTHTRVSINTRHTGRSRTFSPPLKLNRHDIRPRRRWLGGLPRVKEHGG